MVEQVVDKLLALGVEDAHQNLFVVASDYLVSRTGTWLVTLKELSLR